MGRGRATLVESIQGRALAVRKTWAAAAYAFLIFGLVVLVIPMARTQATRWDATLQGAAFGAVVYGVYETTSGSILSDWGVALAVMDVLWGAALYATAAAVAW